jgi:hypothetical protein
MSNEYDLRHLIYGIFVSLFEFTEGFNNELPFFMVKLYLHTQEDHMGSLKS